jgi:hypothetical protein
MLFGNFEFQLSSEAPTPSLINSLEHAAVMDGLGFAAELVLIIRKRYLTAIEYL